MQGLEHLTPGQPYVFAANHRSNFDIFTLLAILPGRLMFVAKKSLFQIPLFGQALRRMGSVPLDRDSLKEAIKSLDRAAARVKAGASMIIFPEGTRVPTPELIPFQEGRLYHGLQGRPAHRAGEHQRHPLHPAPGALQVRPGPVRVVISAPIHPRDYKRKEDLMAAVYQAIAANYDPDYPYGPDRDPA